MSYDDETSSSVPPKNGGQRGVVGEVSAACWDAVTRDVSRPEFFGFQNVIKIKNKSTIFL